MSLKVLFLNPIVDKQKPCEQYLNAKCSDDDECEFSHGQSVLLSQLQPYQDPNYSLLKKRTHVLIRTESSLWKPGTLLEVSQSLRNCQVKLNNSGKVFECPFVDILPPIETGSDCSDLSDLSSNEDYNEGDLYTVRNVFSLENNFGEWEKHTTGFGSKMLSKLGYVSGEGLGKSNI